MSSNTTTEHILSTSISTVSTTIAPESNVTSDHVCKIILFYEIPNTRLRLWDVVILFPNLMFLLFLVMRFNKALLKLRATNSPIFLTFYSLVILNVVISVSRCFVSIIMNNSTVGSYADIILWIFVRFFLLMTEMSVVIFGLAFGHLDSRSSIRHVILVTSLISLVYSICQGSLEVFVRDPKLHVTSKGVLLFGHGGVWFFFVSSIIFTLLYISIFMLPLTRLKDKLALPEKRSFYIYIGVLILLDSTCSVGGAMLLFDITEGLCVMNISMGIYFSFFTPLVYHTFLSDFFEVSQANILFTYKSQADETDDNVSLPRQQSLSSIKTDSDYIYPTSLYANTQFNSVPPVNPLFIASLQSPDSIAGYSMDSQTIDFPSSSKP